MDPIIKILRSFVVAKAVIHYYWVHTEADDKTLRVSIENIQRIVSRLTGLKIEKYTVDFEAKRDRGLVERYKDKVVILVRENQTEEELRFAVVKELFHALSDESRDFSTDIVKTIRDLVNYRGKLLDAQASYEVQSERFAEIMALELLYPFEFRDRDREAVDNGKTIHEISKLRGVPPYWVEQALSTEHLDFCRMAWSTLPVDIQFPPLPAEGSEGVRFEVKAVDEKKV